MATKERLHELIDKLPENTTGAAEHFLEYLMDSEDPVLRALWDAPLDTQPLTYEEAAALLQGWEDIKAGRTVPLEEIEQELRDRQ